MAGQYFCDAVNNFLYAAASEMNVRGAVGKTMKAGDEISSRNKKWHAREKLSEK